MTDRNKNIGDEYQFPEDEYINASNAAVEPGADDKVSFSAEGEGTDEGTADNKSQASRFKGSVGLLQRLPFLANKRVMVVLLVAVVALISFKIMHPKKNVQIVRQSQSTQQATSAESVATEQQMMVQQQQDAVLEKLSRLSQDAQNNEGSVKSLSREVANLKYALNQANSDNGQLQTAMLVLADQVQNLSEELKKATAVKEKVKKLPPAPEVVYYLRAVLPNRAWITGSDGDSNSVVVGSKVQDYGTVQAIDAEEGKVLTSSGKVIAYNSEGN